MWSFLDEGLRASVRAAMFRLSMPWGWGAEGAAEGDCYSTSLGPGERTAESPAPRQPLMRL